MSQYGYPAIIRQLQEQLVTQQAQIQALLEGGVVVGRETGEGLERMANMDVVKPQLFDGDSSKVSGFITGYKIYIRNRLARAIVEEQVQWVLSHVQGGLVDVWKENVMKDLEERALEYESVGEFLVSIKKEFGGEEEESVKLTKLKKLEQGGRTMEEFVQEFRRAARVSGYKGCSLIEEFKRGMNATIRRRLMKAENQPGSIEQWFMRTTILDQNWRESKREEEKLKRKQGRTISKQQE